MSAISIKRDSKLFISELSNAIQAVRAPLFVAALAAVSVTLIDQLQEILFLFAEETFAQSGRQIFFASSLFILFCLLLWRIANDLLTVSNHRTAYASRRAQVLRRMLPVVIAAIPVFGLYAGFASAYRTWATVPTQTVQTSPEAPAPVATATQIAAASEKVFTPYAAVSPVHRIIWAELRNQLGTIAAPARNLMIAAYVTLILGVLAILAGSLFAAFGEQNSPDLANSLAEESSLPQDGDPVVPRSLRWKWLWASSFAAFVTLFALQSRWAFISDIPGWLGSAAIVLLFLIYLTIFLSLLTRLYDKLAIPAISIIFLIATLASYEDWNNNHLVRLETRKGANPAPLSASFADWLKNLQENESAYVQKFIDGKKDYPVFLFALEGGGQYSSILSSLTLAKLFDRCPALRHHVFALSGVSGGAVGAGFFTAQLKTGLADKSSNLNSDRCDFTLATAGAAAQANLATGALEDKLSQLQQSDFLAPLISEGLFGDFLQRFIPWPPIPSLDRGRAFESGLELASRSINAGKVNPLEADFLEHWSPSAPVPMLLLNTTRVQTGEPILAAPILTRRAPVNAAELRTIYRDILQPGMSIRLSTAMSLSAKFPVITPIGRFHRDQAKQYYDLVDGGYFENSGAETVRVVLDELSFYKKNPDIFDVSGALKPILSIIKFKTVALNEDDYYSGKAQDFNELASPFLALYRARSQRGTMAIGQLFSQADLGIVRISHIPFPLPLGWRLSMSKQNFINAVVGTPDECDDASPQEVIKAARLVTRQYQDDRIGNLYYLMHRNRCVLRDIVRDVRGG